MKKIILSILAFQIFSFSAFSGDLQYTDRPQTGDVNYPYIMEARSASYLYDLLHSGAPVSLPNSQLTPGASVISAGASGSIAAGYRSVTVSLSADFSGTVAGASLTPGKSYTWAATADHTVGAIAWTRTAGSIEVITLQ